jgi:hypothetical protein
MRASLVLDFWRCKQYLKSSPATRHMVVIHRAGHVVYMGAIDDTPSIRFADVKTAPN